MEIEEAVVHGLQGEREGKSAVALRGRSRQLRTGAPFTLAYQFAFNLRKTRHRTERHK